MFFYIYIAPGQGHKTLCGQNSDVNRKVMSLCPFVASFKKNIYEVWFIHNFSFFIHVYSPGADNPLGSNFLSKHKPFITLVICCKCRTENYFLTDFPIWKHIRQNWPCRKIGQGQHRVIIWTNHDGPKATMLHSKTQGHWPFGFGEADFWRVFTMYGRGGHFGHVNQTPRTNFHSPDPWRRHMKFGFDCPSGFREEDLWKWWTDKRLTDDGPWLYYKLTNEPKGSGELTKLDNFAIMCMVLTLVFISELFNKKSRLISHDKTNKMACAPSEDSVSALASARSDQSSLCAKWVAKDPYSDSDDSDQTGPMPRLIWVFALTTCHFVGFVMMRLICVNTYNLW